MNNKEYFVKFRVLDMLKQHMDIDQTNFYDDAGEATYAFLEACGRAIDGGCKLEFADKDEQGYMKEHYTDGRHLIMIELNIKGE